jgi:hypothetical protein
MWYRDALVLPPRLLPLRRAGDSIVSARVTAAPLQQGQPAEQAKKAAHGQPAAVLVRPHLEAEVMGQAIEPAVRAAIAGQRSIEIVRGVGVGRLVGLLRLEARLVGVGK